MTLTFRVWIAPIDLIDMHVEWIEIDKFKRTLKPYEKTVVSQTLYPMAFRGYELLQWPM